MLSNAKRLFTNSCFLALVFALAAPASVNAKQYVLKITDATWPADPDFGTGSNATETYLEDDSFHPDKTGAGIPLPFDFPFYCNTYDEVYIDANGFVTLGSTLITGDAVPPDPIWDDTDNFPFPLTAANNPAFYPIPMIAPFWSDIVTEHTHGQGASNEKNGHIWYRLDSSPNRLIVTWEDVFHYYHQNNPPGDPGDPNTTGGNNIQLILYEDGRIQFNYGTMGWSGNDVYLRRDATIGIYSADHTGGACDEGSLPSMEFSPFDDSVAGRQLLYLPDQDLDNISEDGDASGTVGDAFCSELSVWPTEPYGDGVCIAGGFIGTACLFDDECATPGQSDGICDLCGDRCVSCDDNCPAVDNSDQLDTEFDGIGDACDPDDDNDGIPDGSDNFPLDTDNDGMDNDIDADDDNDGILDVNDTYPLDTNNDGEDNDVDDDDDGDGFLDVNDPLPLDYNYADGDLNASGLPVNAADMLLAYRITLGLETATTLHLQHGDVRPQGAPDGVIDLRDVIMVVREALNPGTL